MSTLNRNKAELAGNLVRDIELKTGNSGKEFAKGTLAVNDAVNRKAPPTYVDFVVFGITATNMAKITEKGSNILVEGRISTSSYTDKDGNKRKATELVVNEFQALTRKAKVAEEVAA